MAGKLKLEGELSLDGSGFEKTISRAEQRIERLAEHGFGSLKSAVMEAFTIGAFTELSRRTIEWGDQLSSLSKQTGINTDDLQKWDYAASHANTSLEAMIKGVEKLGIAQAKAATDTKVFAKLQRLGLNEEQIDNLSAAADNFKIIAETIRNADVNGQALNDMVDVLGKSSSELIPMFKNGLAEAGDELRRINGLAKQSDIEKLAEASDQMKDAWTQIRVQLAGIVPILAGLLADMLKFLKLVWIPISAGFDPKRMTKEQKAFVDSVQFSVLDPYNLHGTASAPPATKRGRAYGAEEQADSLQRLEQAYARLEAAQERNRLSGLTAEEKITELKKQQAELVEKMRTEINPEKRVEEYTKYVELDTQLRNLTMEKTKGLRAPANGNIGIGNIFGAGIDIIPDVQERLITANQRNTTSIERLTITMEDMMNAWRNRQSFNGSGPTPP